MPVPLVLRLPFCGLFICLFYFVFRAFHDTLDPVTADPSALSYYYNNHISISTNSKIITYSFIGAGNAQFAKALAIIIYKVMKRNENVNLDKLSVLAAGKVLEHYRSWLGKSK